MGEIQRSWCLVSFLFAVMLGGSGFAQPFATFGGRVPAGLSYGAVFADYDNDNDYDLFTTSRDRPGFVIYRNTEVLTFEAITNALASQKMVVWGDYNGDGWLDFIGTSVTNNETVTAVYKSDKGLEFVLAAELHRKAHGPTSADWGDYDNDGDLDLLLAGFVDDWSGTPREAVQVWTNMGEDRFEKAEIEFPLTYWASEVSWVDLNNDGWLDLAFSEERALERATIYRNNRDGTFSLAFQAESPFVRGRYNSFADYDRDGDLDILLQGDQSSEGAATDILRNDGDLAFTRMPSRMHSMQGGPAFWGDFDNDGRTDAAVGGYVGSDQQNPIRLYHSVGRPEASGPYSASVFSNSVLRDLCPVDLDGNGTLDLFASLWILNQPEPDSFFILRNDATPKGPPGTPVKLAASQVGEMVSFTWDANTEEDRGSGWTYNLRVGTEPGTDNVLPSMSDAATGFRRIVRIGNSGTRRSAFLRLPLGRYYWSVQAVDERYMGSSFAQEQTFEVAVGIPPHATTLEPKKIHPGAVRFEGIINPNGEETLAYFEYGTNSAVTHVSEAVSVSATTLGTNVITITNLPFGETWSVSMVASNRYGVSHGWERTLRMPNEYPVISLATNEILLVPGIRSAPVPIGISDVEFPPESLTLTAESLNPAILPQTNLVLSGEGAAWSLSVLTAPFTNGTASVRLKLTDPGGATSVRSLWIESEMFSFAVNTERVELTADFNNDSFFDFLCRAEFRRVMTNNGGFNFRSAGLSEGGFNLASAAAADFDRDGNVDLAISAFRGALLPGIYLGPENGLLATNPAVSLPFGGYSIVKTGDFNSDGIPDVLSVGNTNNVRAGAAVGTKAGPPIIYFGNPTFEFTPRQIGTRTFMDSIVAVGDFNGDLFLDFICAGAPIAYRAPVTLLYLNTGDGSFTEVLTDIPGMSLGAIDVADIDDDGDLDIAVVGRNSDYVSVTQVYTNSGSATFSRYNVPMLSNPGRQIRWGDFDGDGLYDLLLGRPLNGPLFGALRNRWPNKFEPVSIFASFATAVRWADADSDGDLDAFTSGPTIGSILRNNLPAGEPQPASPQNLTVTENDAGLLFAWTEPVGRLGPLTYNVRVGTGPGRDNIVPALADTLSGTRRVVAHGNAGQHQRFFLNSLPDGEYFWSVQSINAAYRGSPFAAEQTFTVNSGKLAGISFANIAVSAGGLHGRITLPSAGTLILETSENLREWKLSTQFEAHAGTNTFEIPSDAGSNATFVRASLIR